MMMAATERNEMVASIIRNRLCFVLKRWTSPRVCHERALLKPPQRAIGETKGKIENSATMRNNSRRLASALSETQD